MKNIKSISLLLVCLISLPAFAITPKQRFRQVIDESNTFAAQHKKQFALGGLAVGGLGFVAAIVCIIHAGRNKETKNDNVSNIIDNAQSLEQAKIGSLDDAPQPSTSTQMPNEQGQDEHVFTLTELKAQAEALKMAYSTMTPVNYDELYNILKVNLVNALTASCKENNHNPDSALVQLQEEVIGDHICANYTHIILMQNNVDKVKAAIEKDMKLMYSLQRFNTYEKSYIKLKAESDLFKQACGQLEGELTNTKQHLMQMATGNSTKTDDKSNESVSNSSQQSNSGTQVVSTQKTEAIEPEKHQASADQSTTVETNNANAKPSVDDSTKKDNKDDSTKKDNKSDATTDVQGQNQQPSVTEQVAALLDQTRKIKSTNDIVECSNQFTKLKDAMNQLSTSNKEKLRLLDPIRDMMEVASINCHLEKEIKRKGENEREVITKKITTEITKCRTQERLNRLQNVYGLVTFESFKAMLAEDWVARLIEDQEQKIKLKANKSSEGDLDRSYDHIIVSIDNQKQEAESERVSNVQPKQKTFTPELQQQRDELYTTLSTCKKGDASAAASHMRASGMLNAFKDACHRANIDRSIIDPIEVDVRIKYWEVSYLPVVVESSTKSRNRKANRDEMHKKIKEQIARDLEYMGEGFDKNLLLQAYKNLNHPLLKEALEEQGIAVLFA